MTKLSPAAQAVLDGYNPDPFSNTGEALAAVLRAVAEQGETLYWDNCPVQAVTVGSLLAIANELEAHMIVVQLPSKP